MIDRFNARADDYDKWWAPVLAETARTLIDYVEWYTGSPPPHGYQVLEIGTGSGTLAQAIPDRWLKGPSSAGPQQASFPRTWHRSCWKRRAAGRRGWAASGWATSRRGPRR